MKNAPEMTRENLLRLVDEIDDYAIVLLDNEGTIQNWNKGAQRIKGYRADQIIGKNFRLFYTEEDRLSGKPDKLIEKAVTDGAAHDEGWRLRADGTKFWGSITISSIHDDDGQVIGFGKVTRDLTDRREAENDRLRHISELEQKNQELEQFAYIASHDLQEPLRTLRSFTELINQEYSDQLDADLAQYLEFIFQSANRMSELVKGLLDYSRIGKAREYRQIDCNQIVREVVADIRSLIREKNAEITIGSLPVIVAYQVEMRQLFQNLIGNAIKFSRVDVTPKVEISAQQGDDHWEFSVRDNGIGIDEKNFDKIFDIFKRLHNRDQFEGTGIGLSHCKKIVEIHGGTISVESEINRGSNFKFTIPKADL